MWLRATNKDGLTVPWVYVRRRLAQAWGVPPWIVDEAPVDEVLTELRILALEAQAKKGKGTGNRG